MHGVQRLEVSCQRKLKGDTAGKFSSASLVSRLELAACHIRATTYGNPVRRAAAI